MKAKKKKKKHYVKDPGGYIGEAMQSLGMIRPKRRVKIVRGWAVMRSDRYEGHVAYLCRDEHDAADRAMSYTIHNPPVKYVVVPLTGTFTPRSKP